MIFMTMGIDSCPTASFGPGNCYRNIGSDFQFQAGDYVRRSGSHAGSHSIFIYKVVGNTIYFIDCNWDGGAGIRTGTISSGSLVSSINLSEKEGHSSPCSNCHQGFVWRCKYVVDG
jgi:hypothetical protein